MTGHADCKPVNRARPLKEDESSDQESLAHDTSLGSEPKFGPLPGADPMDRTAQQIPLKFGFGAADTHNNGRRNTAHRGPVSRPMDQGRRRLPQSPEATDAGGSKQAWGLHRQARTGKLTE